MSEYETKKFNKFDVENPGDIFSGDRIYNVPYSQRNFSWNTELDDKNKNQVGKFWNALLRQWKSFSEFSSHIEEQRADLEAKKLAGSLTPAEIEAKE